MLSVDVVLHSLACRELSMSPPVSWRCFQVGLLHTLLSVCETQVNTHLLCLSLCVSLTSLLVCCDSHVFSLFELIVTRIERIESNKYISSSFTPYLCP